MAEPVGRQQQKTRRDQGKADKERVVEQRVKIIAQERRRNERQRRHDEKQQQPPPGWILPRAALGLFDVQHHKPFTAEPAQLRMIRNDHRPERPQMQQHIEQHLVFQIADAQEVLQDRKMSGAGDRQKLREPLYDSK